jgi:hypothetical protein
MDIDENYIREFFTTKGLRAEEFNKNEKGHSKTPDFKVFKENNLVFFCEIKTIARDEWAGGSRNDPVYNRLSTKIHEAVNQFNTINPDLKYPNVLVFINHNNEGRCGVIDLYSVFTGFAKIEGGGVFPGFTKFSEGRIKGEKNRIHLFIWVKEDKAPNYLFNEDNKIYVEKLCSYFDINPRDIKH